MSENRKNNDPRERPAQLSQEEETQQLRWQESDAHSGQGSGRPVDGPHDDHNANNKVSTSLDEDSAVK